MLINLHSQATTTPKTRAEIQASDAPARVLAGRYGTTEQTVWKWRKRDSVNDRSHMAHRLQTTLTPAQEAVAVALRKTLPVSLDDLLAVMREFLNPDVSRSGLDRCLRRHGVGNLRDLKAKVARPRYSGFKAYEPGYLHIDVKDLPQMADQTSRRYLFVAIDRATRRVFIRIYSSRTAANVRRFLRDMGSGLAPFASEPYSRTMGRSSPTVSLACASANKAENMSSTGSLRRTGHRTPPDAARIAPDKRYGRALQRSYRRRAAKPPLPIRRRTGDHAAPLCLALQPTTPAISLGQQDALASNEKLPQTQTRTVQQTAILPSGM